MSNTVDYSIHPGNPAAQPFQGRGTPNKTKKKAWWHVNSPTFWRNKKKDTKKKEDKKEQY